MDDKRTAPPGGEKRKPPRHRGGTSVTLVAGWIFLGVMIILATAAVIALLPRESQSLTSPPENAPVSVPEGPGSAFHTDETVPPMTILDGTGGRKVEIGSFRCNFTPPDTVTVSVLKSVDLASVGETVRTNVSSAGWGDVVCSVTGNGELLIRAASQQVLLGGDYTRQEAFLASAQPENLARTFLENSGLIPLLREHGLYLTNNAENDEGMITFRGTGDAPGTECVISFSFLYTGAFNQAVLRATYLDGAVSTDKVLSLKKAGESAVTWSFAENGEVTVIEAELRQIRGLPFYVFTGEDGTVAYALAVDRDVLKEVPGADAVFEEMMRSGIQEYVEVSGAD